MFYKIPVKQKTLTSIMM